MLDGTGTARPFDKYELQDFRTYAESSGTPLKEVLASQRGSREFGALAAALEADSNIGMVIAGRDTKHPGTAYMSFTRRPTAAIEARLATLPLDTTVTYGSPLPHAELVRYSESLVGSLDHLPGVQFLSCGPTPLGDAVEVRYATTGAKPSPTALQQAAATAAEQWSSDGHLKLPVRFTLGEMSERLNTVDAST